MRKVLFISHSAGRTGAPIMLLNFLRWLKENADVPFEILLCDSGPLLPDFEALAPTQLLCPNAENASFSLGSRARQIFKRLFNSINEETFLSEGHEERLISYYKKAGIHIIYSNTVTNGDVLEMFSTLNCHIISHIHELDYWISRSGEANFEKVKLHSDRIIAASNAVKMNLVNKWGLAADNIDVVHSFVPLGFSKASSKNVRDSLGLPENSCLVVGSGYETWRKGKDIFVQLAGRVRSVLPAIPIHFLWIGGWESVDDRSRIETEILELGLKGLVHFIGEVDNPLDYFVACDVFAMVSREDPFPLVALEAALCNKPVVCFAQAGGMPEFVEDDAGFVVPFLDVDAMAARIVDLISDENTRVRLGRCAGQKVQGLYSLERGGRKILQVLKGFGC